MADRQKVVKKIRDKGIPLTTSRDVDEAPAPLLLTTGKKVRLQEPVHAPSYDEPEDEADYWVAGEYNNVEAAPPPELRNLGPTFPKEYRIKYSNEKQRAEELIRIDKEQEMDRLRLQQISKELEKLNKKKK